MQFPAAVVCGSFCFIFEGVRPTAGPATTRARESAAKRCSSPSTAACFTSGFYVWADEVGTAGHCICLPVTFVWLPARKQLPTSRQASRRPSRRSLPRRVHIAWHPSSHALHPLSPGASHLPRAEAPIRRRAGSQGACRSGFIVATHIAAGVKASRRPARGLR